MNFYESEIAKAEKRIKRIEENPDPTKLKSNKMLYELDRDLYSYRLRRWKEGKPFAEGLNAPIFKSMGLEPLNLDMCADRSQLTAKEFGIIRGAGYPDSACDRTVLLMAMYINKLLPPPAFVVSSQVACDPIMLMYAAVAAMFNAPQACLDIGLEANDDTLRYITAQLGEIIEYAAAKVPGVKFDESKLIELQEADRKCFNLLHEIYEFRKSVPCPMAGRDTFRLPLPASYYPDPYKALEFYEVWRDEVAERVAKGIGAVKEEKGRVLWAVSGPFYADPFPILENRGISIPWFEYDMAMRWSVVKYGNYGDEKEYGRKLSILEEEARIINSLSWAGKADRWVEDVLYLCRDLNIDAIINFLQVGCTATVGLAKILEDEADKQLGIPTLQIEGRQLDHSYFDKKQVADQLNMFIDILLRRKAERQVKSH